MIEICSQAQLHRVLIGAITPVFEERHWGSNLSKVNETIELPDTLEALREAAQSRSKWGRRTASASGSVTCRTVRSLPTKLQAKILELREM